MNKSKLRRRFLALSVPALAVVLAITGISYLASTGTVTTTVKPSSTDFIFPVVTGGPVPSALASGGLKYTRLSHLRRHALPGQAHDGDFL